MVRIFVGTGLLLRNVIKTFNYIQIDKKWLVIKLKNSSKTTIRLIETISKISENCNLSFQKTKGSLHSFWDPLNPKPLTSEGFRMNTKEDYLIRDNLLVKELYEMVIWVRKVGLHEYLPCLTKRCKWWHKTDEPPKLWDFDTNLSRPWNSSLLSIITTIDPGQNGEIRVVETTRKTLRIMKKITLLFFKGRFCRLCYVFWNGFKKIVDSKKSITVI